MVCVQGPCPIADHSHVPAYFLTDFSRLTHVETFCLTDSAISFSQGLTCSNAKALTLTANSLKPSSTEHSSQVCVCLSVSLCVSHPVSRRGLPPFLSTMSSGHRPIVSTCANEAVPRLGKQRLIASVYPLRAQ